jgi:hypothetical protein
MKGVINMEFLISKLLDEGRGALRKDPDVHNLVFKALRILEGEGKSPAGPTVIANKVFKENDIADVTPEQLGILKREIRLAPKYNTYKVFKRDASGARGGVYSIEPGFSGCDEIPEENLKKHARRTKNQKSSKLSIKDRINHVIEAVRTLKDENIDPVPEEGICAKVSEQNGSLYETDDIPDKVVFIARALADQDILVKDENNNYSISSTYTQVDNISNDEIKEIKETMELIEAKANLNNPTFNAVRAFTKDANVASATKRQIIDKVKEQKDFNDLKEEYKNMLSEPDILEDELDILGEEVSNSLIALTDIEVLKKNDDDTYSIKDGISNTLTDEQLISAKDVLDKLDDTEAITAKNIIFYGVPGSGKSFRIQGYIYEECTGREATDNIKATKNYKDMVSKEQIRRIVFHPDYAYSDFVGQILPIIKPNESNSDINDVTYEFNPGPFTKIIADAINNPGENYFLIIEEITRGNAAAIFGDIFQLLDRVSDANKGRNIGESEYDITNENILEEVLRSKIAADKNKGKDEVSKDEVKTIRIPNNLWLIATMNTSDQSVFVLDTAFQRRWEMEMIPTNKFTPANKLKFVIGDTGIKWNDFAPAVNKDISALLDDSVMANEDKRLGAWFVRPDDIKENGSISRMRFANKVIKYLWDDAFKYDRKVFFSPEYKTLEDVIEAFVKKVKPLSDIIIAPETKGMLDKKEQKSTPDPTPPPSTTKPSPGSVGTNIIINGD